MRSFAGLYFVARVLLFLSNVLAGAWPWTSYNIIRLDPYFMRNIVLAIILVLLITLCRPYKKAYMNKIDTLLLIHNGLVCHLVPAEYGFMQKRENSRHNLSSHDNVPLIVFFL